MLGQPFLPHNVHSVVSATVEVISAEGALGEMSSEGDLRHDVRRVVGTALSFDTHSRILYVKPPKVSTLKGLKKRAILIDSNEVTLTNIHTFTCIGCSLGDLQQSLIVVQAGKQQNSTALDQLEGWLDVVGTDVPVD